MGHRRVPRKMKHTFFIAALLISAVPATAGMIFDQSPPNGNSYDITNYRLADDFTLSGAATLTSGDFWYQAQYETDLSNLTYAFYADSSGHLGALLTSATVSPVTSWDATNNAYYASFALPGLSLGAGTYWLELHAGTSRIDDNGGLLVSWMAANDNSTAQALTYTGIDSPWVAVGVSGFEQYAFQLSDSGGGTVVPEPSTTLPSALALVWLAAAAVRRARERATRRAGPARARTM